MKSGKIQGRDVSTTGMLPPPFASFRLSARKLGTKLFLNSSHEAAKAQSPDLISFLLPLRLDFLGSPAAVLRTGSRGNEKISS